MMGLPGAVVIDRLVVNHAPGGPIMFGGDDHPAEPRGGLVHWYSLQYSQTNISVKAILDPMYGDRGRGLNSYTLFFFIRTSTNGLRLSCS